MRAPNHETHQLRYATWDERFRVEKPYTIVSDMPWLEGTLKTNLKFAKAPEEVITNVRVTKTSLTWTTMALPISHTNFPPSICSTRPRSKRYCTPRLRNFSRPELQVWIVSTSLITEFVFRFPCTGHKADLLCTSFDSTTPHLSPT